jgi:uncharacterized protein
MTYNGRSNIVKPMMDKALIQQAVDRIVTEAQPLQVILFGSQARGDALPDSDADFLVIGYFEEPKAQVFMRINKSLSHLNMDRDIVLMTPDAFASTCDIPGTIAYPAAKEGIVLYDAQG